MPYHVGAKGSSGCAGYPAIKTGTGEVMGCHETRAQAAAQIYAINRSEGKIGKAMFKEGDMVMAPSEDEIHVGRVVHVMTDGMLGFPGSEYSIPASPEEPAVLIQLFEMEDGGLDETEYFVGHKASDLMAMPSLEENTGMDKAEKPNYDQMIKPRRGGSEPANPRLYARIQREAKDKFDVYPSAVANGWVVQEYKRRGGTYKGEGIEAEKREFSTASRERMAESGAAMPDGSFPIANRNDLMNALRSLGRAKDYNAAKQHIMRRARALGLTDMLPEDWKKSVTKTMWGGTVFDLNPFVK